MSQKQILEMLGELIRDAAYYQSGEPDGWRGHNFINYDVVMNNIKAKLEKLDVKA